jgi:AmiR/NasT family two-component response regulator
VVTEDLIDLQAQGMLQWAPSDHLGQRARVHQATGMVSVQISADMISALARIRAYAFANEISIFKVADMVLDRTLRLPLHTLE